MSTIDTTETTVKVTRRMRKKREPIIAPFYDDPVKNAAKHAAMYAAGELPSPELPVYNATADGTRLPAVTEVAEVAEVAEELESAISAFKPGSVKTSAEDTRWVLCAVQTHNMRTHVLPANARATGHIIVGPFDFRKEDKTVENLLSISFPRYWVYHEPHNNGTPSIATSWKADMVCETCGKTGIKWIDMIRRKSRNTKIECACGSSRVTVNKVRTTIVDGEDPVLLSIDDPVIGELMKAWVEGPPHKGFDGTRLYLPRLWDAYPAGIGTTYEPATDDIGAQEIVRRAHNTVKRDGTPFPLQAVPYGLLEAQPIESWLDSPKTSVGWVPVTELEQVERGGLRRNWGGDPTATTTTPKKKRRGLWGLI